MNIEAARHGRLKSAIETRTATVGICGLGYVGLPLAIAVNRAGFTVIGLDIDKSKVDHLNAGRSYLGTVTDEAVARARTSDRLSATSDFDQIAACDVVIVCVPTPLTRHREPDLAFLTQTAADIATRLRPGQLIVVESTTYPGTTTEVVKPILERSGWVAERDFFLGFSPEREDPGNVEYATATIAKVVAGDGPISQELVSLFYGAFIERIVPVSSTAAAEAVKITENVFRAVNIALVNELKIIYGAMGIDIWEVIDAAKTKPFGYMPFYPGPGLGGHCIPIDPFYLTWKAREHGIPTRFIELAGEINTAMPARIVARVEEALDRSQSISLSCARVLILGMAYKKNVSDTRESPGFTLMELLEHRGAAVDYHDPLVPEIPANRDHPKLGGRRSVGLDRDHLSEYDVVLIATDHDVVDYSALSAARLVVDCRNACARRGLSLANVVKA